MSTTAGVGYTDLFCSTVKARSRPVIGRIDRTAPTRIGPTTTPSAWWSGTGRGGAW
ncbi:hypothetical protein [Nonomuraea sp. NPDC049784]|uniref:hypothetical protein n=1 Tax=Nonomuraea sp. NPDC049784 TaxID=3154361 RepID=UPI00340E228B